jgi:hypothetical protein
MSDAQKICGVLPVFIGGEVHSLVCVDIRDSNSRAGNPRAPWVGNQPYDAAAVDLRKCNVGVDEEKTGD